MTLLGLRMFVPTWMIFMRNCQTCLLRQDDITLIQIKDYIKKPKRKWLSVLTLTIEIPVYFSDSKRN